MGLGRDAIIAYMVDELCIDESEVADDDTLLFSSGLLDSFSMINLIGFIEREAGIRVRPTEVTPDNLDSLGRIMNYLERRIADNS